jgi:hypothetical protein
MGTTNQTIALEANPHIAIADSPTGIASSNFGNAVPAIVGYMGVVQNYASKLWILKVLHGFFCTTI